MNDITPLRKCLDRWAKRRLLARRALVVAQFGAVASSAMLAAFAIDDAMRLPAAARAVMLCAGVGAAVWASRRWLVPRWRSRESTVEMALLIERRQRLESDLVAALQFESPIARRWGSADLRRAVIDYVAEYAKTLRLPRGRPAFAALVWAASLLMAAAAWIVLMVYLPAHTAAFAHRCLFADAHYPTHTRIETIEIDRAAVPKNSTTKAISGQPLELNVRCWGRLPETGKVIVRSADGTSVCLELQRDTRGAGDYAARIPRLYAPVVCQVNLGDAWPERFELQTVERPQVELAVVVKPPDYAPADAAAAQPQPGMAQWTVLEGSQVALELRSQNKPLEKVVLELDGEQYDFTRESAGRRHWRLSPPPPLRDVRRHVKFALAVSDVDGIAPAEPMAGVIRVEPDRPPTVHLSARSTVVLPTARPMLEYDATDDVAIARLRIDRELKRGAQSTRLEPIDLEVAKKSMAIHGSQACDLGELALTSGDELRIALTATDDRGRADGQTAVSEPLVFRVTDQAGLLASLSQAEGDLQPPSERAARVIDADESSP
ncbi:MAG TPA: hypothetical protein VJ783_32170 [Pirellulales bacterium]|nr:hypothetical protein [Pirellulales bacterium]